MTVIIFIIVLAILIFVHEFGHFIAARACGIRVDAFALGFGPKIWSHKSGETEYSIRILPLGGFVKIFGEDPNEENTSGPDSSRSFVNKPRWQQAIVLASGVLCNFIFAWVLYAIIFTSGVTALSAGDFDQYAGYLSNDRIMITDVQADSPANKAGLKAGDVITGFENTDNIQQVIRSSAGSVVSLSYIDHGISTTTKIVPSLTKDPAGDYYAIGIAMEKVADLHLPFYISIWEGLKYTGNMIKDTTVGLVGFVVTIIRGTADYSQISGPVGIAGIVGNAASLGFAYLVMITAIISINLGVINLVPFPALDGGRILVVAIEAVIRRRVSPKYVNAINIVGFVLLMALMVLVTYKDILKLVK